MVNRPCCRTCRHCLPPRGPAAGWCQLRQLAIHVDLAGDVSCHHWMTRCPRPPAVAAAGGGAEARQSRERQLRLAVDPCDS